MRNLHNKINRLFDFLTTLYGAKILSMARNRSGKLPVIIMEDTSQGVLIQKGYDEKQGFEATYVPWQVV